MAARMPSKHTFRKVRPEVAETVVVQTVAAAEENAKKVNTKAGEKSQALKEQQQDKIAHVEVGYDFRDLKDPERTFKRIEAFINDRRFSHAEHAAGTLLILAFRDKPVDAPQLISFRKLLSEEKGYSSTMRTNFTSKIKELGVIEVVNFTPKIGTEIKLNF